MQLAARPLPAEAPEYYFRYIDLVPDDDVLAVLSAQLTETTAYLSGIPRGRAAFRYEAGKWSIAEVVAHLNDAERVFAFRAFWFARGFESALPSFDQEISARGAGADERPWSSLVDEFQAIRSSSLDLLHHLPPGAWMRQGIASDRMFTVRATAFIMAGHVIHHLQILKDRYAER